MVPLGRRGCQAGLLLDADLEPFSSESPVVIQTSAHLQGPGGKASCPQWIPAKAGHEQCQLNRILGYACSHTRKHTRSPHLHHRLSLIVSYVLTLKTNWVGTRGAHTSQQFTVWWPRQLWGNSVLTGWKPGGSSTVRF